MSPLHQPQRNGQSRAWAFARAGRRCPVHSPAADKPQDWSALVPSWVLGQEMRLPVLSKVTCRAAQSVRPFSFRSRRGPLNPSRRQPAGFLLFLPLSAATLVPGAARHASHNVTEPLPVVVVISHVGLPEREKPTTEGFARVQEVFASGASDA